MKRSVSIKFEKRPESLGIIWSHDYEDRSYPGKLLPGYVVSAKCLGVMIYLEIVDVKYEHSINARIFEIDDEIDDYDIVQMFETCHVLSLTRDHVFTCEPPSGKKAKKEKSKTILIKTQCLQIFDVN